MPIYEYECSKCRKAFEELSRSMSEDEKVSCPACGSQTVTRRQSVFSARQGSTTPSLPIGGGACGRCGDPNGPCGS